MERCLTRTQMENKSTKKSESTVQECTMVENQRLMKEKTNEDTGRKGLRAKPSKQIVGRGLPEAIETDYNKENRNVDRGLSDIIIKYDDDSRMYFGQDISQEESTLDKVKKVVAELESHLDRVVNEFKIESQAVTSKLANEIGNFEKLTKDTGDETKSYRQINPRYKDSVKGNPEEITIKEHNANNLKREKRMNLG